MFSEMINLGPPRVAGADLPRGPDPDQPSDVESFASVLGPRVEGGQKIPLEVQKKTATPEAIIKEFMDSFESEFKVPVARLVKGIEGQIENSAGMSTESAALNAIKQLGLTKEEQERASKMVLAFIQNLQDLVPQVRASGFSDYSLSPLKLGMLQRIDQEKQHRDYLHKSLDQMQSQFWQPKQDVTMETDASSFNDTISPESESIPSTAPTIDLPISKNTSFEKTQISSELASNDVNLMSRQQKPDIESERFFSHQRGQGALTPERFVGMIAFGLNQRRLEQSLPKVQEGLLTETPAESFSIQGVSSGDLGITLPQQGSTLFNENSGFQSKEDSNPKQIEKSQQSEAKESQDSLRTLMGISGLSSGLSSATSSTSSLPAVTPGLPVTQEQAEVNVQRVLSQANFLIKKGGGEVKVLLTPEGLGEIRLKVSVNDGQVGVQMQASNPEAKKMIEGGFGELKKTLANHNLSIDPIKVDVVSSLSTDVSTQGGRSGFDSSTSSQQQDSRQSSQQFWSQFHQNFGSPHQQSKSYAEMRWDNMRTSKNPEPLEPVTSGVTTKKRIVGNKGSGLNMVA